MTAAHLHIEGLVRNFGDRSVLNGVDLLVQGGVIALLGSNGAGKTTLLRCVASLLEPDSGSVRVDGLNARSEAERIEIRRRLGYLPQESGFAAGSTVFDAVDYLAVLKEHRDDRLRRRLVTDALDSVGLADRMADRVSTLSTGMRRRVGLAQAMLGAPALLLLDEPAAGLDPDERQRVRDLLAARRGDATIMVSTHLTDDAADADLVAVLHGGRIVFFDQPSRLAALADGRVWFSEGPPPAGTRSATRQADGRVRCLGLPPPDAELGEPRLEDGYLLLTS